MRTYEYKKLIFTCDNCDKESKDCSKNKGFPYPDGWTYIYKFKVKIYGKRIGARDKHFCSEKCIKEFVIKRLSKTQEGKK